MPIHPICHKVLHVNFTNKQLEAIGSDIELLRADPEIKRFLDWVVLKPADFNAPTHRRKS